jgi:hypothetical protein
MAAFGEVLAATGELTETYGEPGEAVTNIVAMGLVDDDYANNLSWT